MFLFHKFNQLLPHPGYNLGSTQTGGSVVAEVSPSASAAAGNAGVAAANEASSLAAQSIGAAISATNSQYQTAVQTLQPYTQEGVQALDKLNSYIGLDPYNPGTAPVAPTAPTLQSLEAGVSSTDINNYITQNSTANMNSKGQQFGYDTYSGVAGTNSGIGTDSTAGDTGEGQLVGTLGQLEGNQTIQDAVRQNLAQQELNNPDSYQNLLYGIQNTAYQTDSSQYNYAEGLYQSGTAAGPMTSSQVENSITNLPGYQAQLQQGTSAINADAASKGYLGSGMMLKELDQFGQNTMSQFYGNTLSQLASLAGAGQNAANSTATAATNEGNALSSLFTTLGTDQGNAALSAGNSLAQSLIAGGTTYQTVGQSSTSNTAGIGSLIGSLGSLASSFSNSALKDKITDVTTKDILASVQQLNIDKWKYKGINQEHIGPYAEQFKELFGVGDGLTINMIDMLGVLVASVKQLKQEIETLKGN